MEEYKNYNFEAKDAKYHLTLRYNPLQTHLIPKISPSSFLPKHNSYSIEFIENCIKKSIQQKIGEYQNKKIMISLSSGVDSTLVFGIIKTNFPNLDIESISIKFPESIDETTSAIKLSEKYNTSCKIFEINHLFEELPKAISILKQPFWDLHLYYVMKKISQTSNILITGDGGDELFGGYTFRYEKFLSLINEKSTIDEKIHAYMSCHERDNVPDQEDIFSNKMEFSWKIFYSLLRPFFNNDLSLIEQIFLADYNGKLIFNFLPINHYLSNYFKINSFSPILSSELIEYALKIPINEKFDSKTNTGKIILRKLLEKYNLEKFVHSKKLGFSINTKNYWNSKAKNICKDFLLDSEISKNGWISQSWIDKYIDKENLDYRYVNKFFGLLAYEIWYRLFITKSLNPNSKL